MIGEFEFDDLFSVPYKTRQMNYPGLSLILFSIFLIVMSIILMNLLVGLAVDDIKAVAEQAALQRLAMQVNFIYSISCYSQLFSKFIGLIDICCHYTFKADLVLSVEGYLPNFIRRRFTRRQKTMHPNRRYRFKIFTYFLQNSNEYLDSIANAQNYKEEVRYLLSI